MRTLRISVRRLVEFLLRSGDIDSEHDWHGSIEAMQAGSAIHRMLQASAGDAYQAEVPLSCSLYFPACSFSPHAARLDISEEMVGDQPGFFFRVEGRADGIIDDGTHPLVIDEIKGVSRDISDLDEPAILHEAQALCYAYLYLRRKRGSAALSSAFGEQVTVRLTYASMTTGEVRQIERTHLVPDIEAWFFSLLEKAQRWAEWRIRHDELRGRSLSSLAFPLNPRPGQQQLMDAVATTIHKGARLYAQASTGSGKTIATLYPTLKAMGSGEVSRVAYLTAKTMTRRAALDCLDLLRPQDVATNVLVVTARDKLCPLRDKSRGIDVRSRPLTSLCNPIECPLARGHYDSANDALYDSISTYDVLDAGCVRNVAARHHVCPYELQRDLARWADIIICDYHYAFSPSASLLGLADEPGGNDTVFLIDEAHNLVERMREMYSSELCVSDLKRLERLLKTKPAFAELTKTLRTVVSAFPVWDKGLASATFAGPQARKGKPSFQKVHLGNTFTNPLAALADGINSSLELLSDDSNGRDVELVLALRDMSLQVRSFIGALQRSEVGYVTFLGRDANGGRRLKIYCVDPSHDLDERLEQAKASVFFSGTLLPMEYHRKLLAAQDEDTSLYVQSSFDYRRQQVFISSDVSARFSKRGPELYARIGAYLVATTHALPGNYLTFFPSYAFMEEVATALAPLVDGETEVLRQSPGMREGERELFVSRFRKQRTAGRSLIGLCVLGGFFGESIDLPGEALVGVAVVGTGMPRTSAEREVIRSHFDSKEGKGFAYAYTYPSLVKVLQAAGRLIRTEKDHGVVLLLDDRFLESELRDALPKEWKDVRTCTLQTLPSLLT